MRFAFVSVAILATSVAHAATPIDGWYAGVFGGYAYVPDNVYNLKYGVRRSNASFQSGYDAGISIGYKGNPMRYEGELTYINANLNNFKVNYFPQTGVSGSNNDILGMANVYYDFQNMGGPIQPFLGLGIGYAWVQDKLNSTGPMGITQYTGSNSAFAYQATAGLTYNFAENYALNIGYRYVATVQVSSLGSMFQTSLANVGVVYRFDGKSYK